jgi:DNA-directed RNA polymerase specialized sigma24 family protein
MATSFTSVSFTPSPKSASWCFLLLEHLDEFATLVWYLVADGKLVEDTFARTMAKLDTTAFESSIPALACSQARDVLITQAIAVLSDARREEDENQCFHPSSICSLPDLPRLAFILRLITRSSETEVAKLLGLSRSEVQGFVTYAIDRLSIAPPMSALTGCHDALIAFGLSSP